jgi:UDP-2,3-diacylglucosamine hydrolase
MNALTAPPHWNQIDFISDIHLSEKHLSTYSVWQQYLHNNNADAIFILGDLFEAWIGDDIILENGFERDCAMALQQCSQQKPIFMLHGNRDFLTQHDFFQFTGITAISDPFCLQAFDKHYLLSHGDEWCTSDTAYMQLRAVVRSAAWQNQVLALPIATRKQMADKIKADKLNSHLSAQEITDFYKNLDINHEIAIHFLKQNKASCLIHGHTHHPKNDFLQAGLERWVLSDWEVENSNPRAEVLELTLKGFSQKSLLTR